MIKIDLRTAEAEYEDGDITKIVFFNGDTIEKGKNGCNDLVMITPKAVIYEDRGEEKDLKYAALHQMASIRSIYFNIKRILVEENNEGHALH